MTDLMKFGVIRGGKYITIEAMEYKNIKVPCNFEFDGVTISAPFTFLFSNKDLRQGIRASCFHDWMCEHQSEYSRRYATQVLVEIWKEDGLEDIKAWFVKHSVNFYQWLKGWK